MKKILLLMLIFGLSLSVLAGNQDLSLYAMTPKSNEIPEPKLNLNDNTPIKNKSITKLKMNDHVSLQPRLEYDNYLNIKPTKPQMLGFNLLWDI